MFTPNPSERGLKFILNINHQNEIYNHVKKSNYFHQHNTESLGVPEKNKKRIRVIHFIQYLCAQRIADICREISK